jgi:hypothetical protein
MWEAQNLLEMLRTKPIVSLWYFCYDLFGAQHCFICELQHLIRMHWISLQMMLLKFKPIKVAIQAKFDMCYTSTTQTKSNKIHNFISHQTLIKGGLWKCT